MEHLRININRHGVLAWGLFILLVGSGFDMGSFFTLFVVEQDTIIRVILRIGFNLADFFNFLSTYNKLQSLKLFVELRGSVSLKLVKGRGLQYFIYVLMWVGFGRELTFIKFFAFFFFCYVPSFIFPKLILDTSDNRSILAFIISLLVRALLSTILFAFL